MSHDNYCQLRHNPDLPETVCACKFIAEVRADECEEILDRQKAAMFNDFGTDSYGNLVLYWETAAAAARGDGAE